MCISSMFPMMLVPGQPLQNGWARQAHSSKPGWGSCPQSLSSSFSSPGAQPLEKGRRPNATGV